MIVVLDCGIGNITSVAKMLTKAGAEVKISVQAEDIEQAKAIVFPGVGAFDNGITKLKSLPTFALIEQRVQQDKVPFLGICLGMQLLFESSEEGQLPGLGWIKGKVTHFDFTPEQRKSLKVPHMGWNIVKPVADLPLLDPVEEQRFYFVHSFHANCDDPADIMAQSHYGYDFVSAVARDNVYGIQCHPEKSHRFGLQFFTHLLRYIGC